MHRKRELRTEYFISTAVTKLTLGNLGLDVLDRLALFDLNRHSLARERLDEQLHATTWNAQDLRQTEGRRRAGPERSVEGRRDRGGIWKASSRRNGRWDEEGEEQSTDGGGSLDGHLEVIDSEKWKQVVLAYVLQYSRTCTRTSRNS